MLSCAKLNVQSRRPGNINVIFGKLVYNKLKSLRLFGAVPNNFFLQHTMLKIQCSIMLIVTLTCPEKFFFTPLTGVNKRP